MAKGVLRWQVEDGRVRRRRDESKTDGYKQRKEWVEEGWGINGGTERKKIWG